VLTWNTERSGSGFRVYILDGRTERMSIRARDELGIIPSVRMLEADIGSTVLKGRTHQCERLVCGPGGWRAPCALAWLHQGPCDPVPF